MSTAAPAISLGDRWWTVEHVRLYLALPSADATRKWMQRRTVEKCKTDRRLTCQAWIDAALAGRGKTTFVSTTKTKEQK